ncbi:MAG: hypothetical protein RLZZ450_5710 [Pseudomonadota bacterium]|jgi:hypothetical protein
MENDEHASRDDGRWWAVYSAALTACLGAPDTLLAFRDGMMNAEATDRLGQQREAVRRRFREAAMTAEMAADEALQVAEEWHRAR